MSLAKKGWRSTLPPPRPSWESSAGLSEACTHQAVYCGAQAWGTGPWRTAPPHALMVCSPEAVAGISHTSCICCCHDRHSGRPLGGRGGGEFAWSRKCWSGKGVMDTNTQPHPAQGLSAAPPTRYHKEGTYTPDFLEDVFAEQLQP